MKLLNKIIIAIFCSLQVVVYAQERGLSDPSGTDRLEIGEYYILSIGIDDYQEWPNLENAVNDAQGLANILKENYGFKDIVQPLYNKDANKTNIVNTIEDVIRQKLDPNDNLIVFFAGHGHTDIKKVGSKSKSIGYLVPNDGKEASKEAVLSSFVRIDDFLRSIGELPNKHITVILDACHSGFALSEDISRTRSGTRYMSTLMNNQSRKVITSARSNQLASDSGPLPAHSLFTGTLIAGLEDGSINRDDFPWIHFSELAFSLQSSVSSIMGEKQTPDYGSFYEDERGEMVIIPKSMSKIDFMKRRVETTPSIVKVRNYKKPKRIKNLDLYIPAVVGGGLITFGSLSRASAVNDYNNIYVPKISPFSPVTIGTESDNYNRINQKYKRAQVFQIAGGIVGTYAIYKLIRFIRKKRAQ
jgi:hypothetical protein